MWEFKYEPPKSIFDEIEPVACIVFLIALVVIVSFTPLSPFTGLQQSSFDQLVKVNAPIAEERADRTPPVRMEQVETGNRDSILR